MLSQVLQLPNQVVYFPTCPEVFDSSHTTAICRQVQNIFLFICLLHFIETTAKPSSFYHSCFGSYNITTAGHVPASVFFSLLKLRKKYMKKERKQLFKRPDYFLCGIMHKVSKI